MRKTLMVLLVLVSLSVMVSSVAHAEGRPIITPTSDYDRR